MAPANRNSGIPTASQEALQPPRFTPMSLLGLLAGFGRGEEGAELAEKVPELIKLKPNQVVYKNLAEMMAHAKPYEGVGPNSILGGELSQDALKALSARYPRLTSQLVKMWKQSILPPSVLAQTSRSQSEKVPEILATPFLASQMGLAHRDLMGTAESVLPTFEHELTHAVQDFLTQRGLGRAFKIPGKGLGDILLEPAAYARGDRRIEGFGSKPTGLPDEVLEAIKERLKNRK